MSLALKSDFNLIDAFSQLDKECKSEVTQSELKQQLGLLGVELGSEDIQLIFGRYAGPLLTYSNFTDMVLPAEDYYCRILIGKRL